MSFFMYTFIRQFDMAKCNFQKKLELHMFMSWLLFFGKIQNEVKNLKKGYKKFKLFPTLNRSKLNANNIFIEVMIETSTS